MFLDRREVLKQPGGSLVDVPFPVLLHALAVEERTGTLELKLRNLEKRIAFEDGAPVECASNLLHETLGKYLVAKGKLTEPQYQATLGESAATGKALGGVLVEKKLVAPFELFRHLQSNLAHKILDVFRWQDASWKLLPPSPVATPIRMNSAQLIFTGCAQLVDAQVDTLLALAPVDRVVAVTEASDAAGDLKLSAKDTRLLQRLKAGATVDELCATLGLERAVVLRRLIAFFLLGRAKVSDGKAPPQAPVAAPPPPPSAPAPAPVPAAPAGVPFLDEDAAAKDLLGAELLSFRAKDPFDLLGVSPDVQPTALQRAYLARSGALPPGRFQSAELRQKAELLAEAFARAFGALCEPEGLQLHRRRREVAKEAAQNARKSTAAEHFRIRTDLLDAGTQFDEGLKLFNSGNVGGALKYFEYACDIEPKARFRAYLALARTQSDPVRLGPKALAELGELCAAEPSCEEAWAFRGDLARGLAQPALADECYRKAYALNPNQKRYAEALQQLARGRKA
ncbi:MAG: DUF4388 domain-containing protein [Myxococcaceae bacterium]|nr:DUF4388 domain-containing protein [Myxococcaceae bacterium]